MRKLFNSGNIIRFLISAIFIVAFVFIYLFQFQIISFFDKSGYADVVDATYKICFFDVGQADCSLITYKDENILIDAGLDDSAEKLIDDIKKITKGETIDHFFVSHSDSDHSGGGNEIFEAFHIKNFYRPKVLSESEYKTYGDPNNYGYDTTSEYDNLIMSAYEEKDCMLHYTDSSLVVTGEGYDLKVLYPYETDVLEPENSNDYSAVIMAEVGEIKALFMADVNAKIEQRLAKDYGDELDCDILKVTHHGSKNGSVTEFLNCLSAKHAVLSVGDYGVKTYGHASEEVLSRLTNAGCTTYQTNEDGHIFFTGVSFDKVFYFKEFPSIHIEIIAGCFGLGVMLVWGVKPRRKKTSKK